MSFTNYDEFFCQLVRVPMNYFLGVNEEFHYKFVEILDVSIDDVMCSGMYTFSQ